MKNVLKKAALSVGAAFIIPENRVCSSGAHTNDID
jgi:hypothetical protein